MTLLALLLTQFGALCVYLMHPQQRLVRHVPSRTSQTGTALLAAGVLTWIEAIGPGAGIASALTAAMTTWVVLPYMSWWCGKQAQPARTKP